VNIDIGIGRRRFNSTLQNSSSALANVHAIFDGFYERQFCIQSHEQHTGLSQLHFSHPITPQFMQNSNFPSHICRTLDAEGHCPMSVSGAAQTSIRCCCSLVTLRLNVCYIPRTSTETTRVCGETPSVLLARHRYVPASNLRTDLIFSDPVSHCTHSSISIAFLNGSLPNWAHSMGP